MESCFGIWNVIIYIYMHMTCIYIYSYIYIYTNVTILFIYLIYIYNSYHIVSSFCCIIFARSRAQAQRALPDWRTWTSRWRRFPGGCTINVYPLHPMIYIDCKYEYLNHSNYYDVDKYEYI
jgi:hypothetical protein